MQLFHKRSGQWALLSNGIKEPVHGRGVIPDHPGDQFRGLVRCIVGDERCIDSLLDQQLGGAMVECVDALDDPRFDSPLPFQAFVEAVYLDTVQLLVHIFPSALQTRAVPRLRLRGRARPSP